MINGIKEVVDVAMRVDKETPHDVFFNYSGHVGWFELVVHIGGWKKDGVDEEIHRLRYDKYFYRNGNKTMIRFLNSLLE